MKEETGIERKEGEEERNIAVKGKCGGRDKIERRIKSKKLKRGESRRQRGTRGSKRNRVEMV